MLHDAAFVRALAGASAKPCGLRVACRAACQQQTPTAELHMHQLDCYRPCLSGVARAMRRTNCQEQSRC